MKRLTIIGHRGAKGLAPENTIESIQKSLQHSVDAIELDVRLQNNSLVLSHNPTMQQEVYSPLIQALKEIRGTVPLILDVKESRVVKPLVVALESYNGRVVFSSNKYRILHEIKAELPDAELAIIEKWSGVRAVAEASLLGTNRIHINQNWLWSKFVKSMIHEGYELYAYTVNNKDRAVELQEWGVSGIFTDYPNKF